MIARRYAKALLELSLNEGRTKAVKADMEKIETLTAKKSYFDFFTDRSINAVEKMEVISSLDDLTKDFMRLVIRNKRERDLPLISRQYIELLDRKSGIVDVEAVSCSELDTEERKKLANKIKKLTARQPVIKYKIDRRMVGGIRLKYEGKVLDGSVTGMLSDLKRIMLGS
jgi:F-type H+-transporting ATPase subunit delta